MNNSELKNNLAPSSYSTAPGWLTILAGSPILAGCCIKYTSINEKKPKQNKETKQQDQSLLACCVRSMVTL